MSRQTHRFAGNRRRPWPRFGPSLLLAILAGVLIWNGMPRRPGPPPVASGAVREPSPPPKGPPSAPDPAWLLAHKNALALSPEQTVDLSRLADRWNRDTKDLRVELDAAQREFEDGMRANGGRPMAGADLRERAAPVSDLSRRLGAARRAWWAEASGVLSPEQRARAEEMWAKRFEATRPGSGGEQ